MSGSLPTFGSTLRENKKLRTQNNQLTSQIMNLQKHRDALLRHNTFLKKQIQHIQQKEGEQ